MSRPDGWSAVNLQMPRQVPRFEPSVAHYHWDLIKAVTGLEVSDKSSREDRQRAASAFVKAWDYDIYLASLISREELDAKRTRMGHAEYAKDKSDFDGEQSCPFKDVEDVFRFDPWEVYGKRDKRELIRRFNEQYRMLSEQYPDTLCTTGIYITLMSGMVEIFGWDMLLTAAGTDARRFGDVVNRYAGWIGQYYDALAECEAEVIYSHDDIVWTEGPFMHPDWYRRYIFSNLKKLWEPLRASGKKIVYVGDGNYAQFADDIARCGNHGFWFEIFTDLQFMAEKFGQTHFLIGNADTRILTFGTREDIRREVERCLGIGKKLPGYFICVSGHIPPNVPVENALYYNEVYEELSDRK